VATGGNPRGTVLGPLEAEVMQVVWRQKRPLTVRELLEQLNDGRSPQLAYTTVMTVMNRLTDKDVLRREPRGRGYVYEATASDQAAIAVRQVMREFGDAAVARFVEEARADPELLKRLERLLDAD
jgi:predicted transcriptional regulator